MTKEEFWLFVLAEINKAERERNQRMTENSCPHGLVWGSDNCVPPREWREERFRDPSQNLIKTAIEGVADRWWRVSSAREDGIEVATFTGPNAYKRAFEYACWQYGSTEMPACLHRRKMKCSPSVL
jgi:hypothetical protein